MSAIQNLFPPLAASRIRHVDPNLCVNAKVNAPASFDAYQGRRLSPNVPHRLLLRTSLIAVQNIKVVEHKECRATTPFSPFVD